MIKLRIPFTIFMVFLCSSCASTKNNYFSEEILPKNFGSYSVLINDQRPSSEDRKLKIPIVSFPWQADLVSPRLAIKKLEDEFNNAIEAFLTKGKRSIDFEVNVLESNQGFIANNFSETLTVSWRIELLVKVKGENNRQVEGSCSEERTSRDASYKKIKKMYGACFRSSIQRALNKMVL